MKNMFQMIKEAASMQRNVKTIQEALRQKTIEFSGAGGKIVVTARGDATIANIRIDPSLVDPERTAALEKILLTTLDGALEAARNMSTDEVRRLATDMGLPDIPGL